MSVASEEAAAHLPESPPKAEGPPVEDVIVGACSIGALVLAVAAAIWLNAHSRAPLPEQVPPFATRSEQAAKSDGRLLLPQPPTQ